MLFWAMLQLRKYNGERCNMDDKLLLMKEKIRKLNDAAKAYYQENSEIMSNFEYDKLYDELDEMEKETGIILSNSPTIHVGYELLSNLPKEHHEKVMLSLDKTKEVSALKDWLGLKDGILSWKLDDKCISLDYIPYLLTMLRKQDNVLLCSFV